MKYNELREKRRNSMEAKYLMAKASGNLEEEARQLYRLYMYNLLDEEDERLAKKNINRYSEVLISRCFKRLSDRERFKGELPKNLLFSTPYQLDFEVFCDRHWTKRKELQYVGDIIADEKYIQYSIIEKGNYNQALGAINGMKELYRKLFNSDELEIDKSKIESGEIKMFDIGLVNGISFQIRKLGYLYMLVSGNAIKIVCLLDHKDMIEQCIDVKNTYNELKELLITEMDRRTKTLETEFISLADIGKVSKYQHSIVRREPTFSIINGGE